MNSVPCPCCDGSAKLDLDSAEGLRRLRVVLGMTGKDAAARLKVHPTTVSNFEHGRFAAMGTDLAGRYRRILLAELHSSST